MKKMCYDDLDNLTDCASTSKDECSFLVGGGSWEECEDGKKSPMHEGGLPLSFQQYSLRLWLAGMALQGLIAKMPLLHESDYEAVAKKSFKIAAVMMKEKDKQGWLE